MVTSKRAAQSRPAPASPPWRSSSSDPTAPRAAVAAQRETVTGRIPLALPSPSTPGDLFRPKAFAGEVVPFRTTAFREGHDLIGVHVRLFSPSGDESLHRLSPLHDGFDRWATLISPLEQGVWSFRFEAFGDDFATWEHAADLKIEAGVDSALMREMGARLFDRAVAEKSRPLAQRRVLTNAAARLRDSAVSDEAALEIVRDHAIAEYFADRPLASLVTLGETRELLVERERAGVGAWYEFFPRSEGAKRLKDGTIKSGTFRTAAKRIPAVAAMGFEVLYLPPIHPIGRLNRKGRNNSLDPQARRPGIAVGHRRGRGRSRHRPSRPRHARGFPRLRPRGESGGHGGRAGPRPAGCAGSPLGGRASRVVHDPSRRLDRLCRESAEEVPGHLSDQLRQRSRGDQRRGAPHRPPLDRPGREDLPGRQSAHQAAAVLGVAHRER